MTEDGKQKTEDGRQRMEVRGQIEEFGSGTRRRPKRMGLCRGKHAEVGKKELKANPMASEIS